MFREIHRTDLKDLDYNMYPLTEKYRPNKLSECILTLRISKKLEKWKKSRPNHLIFYGNAGIGKTSTAVALAKELSPDDYTIINASKYNDDNFINNFVTKLMRGVSLYGQKRIIILDESDRLTEKAQTSLRRPLEEYSHLCSVIFTFNYDNKVIEPIKSRCFEFNFNLDDNEKGEVKAFCKKRLKSIIRKEKKEVSSKELDLIINKNFPDMRRCVNELELY